MSKETGGQAFPGPADHMCDGRPIYEDGCGGMTLRDYFAAKAMQGLVSQSGDTAYESKAELCATWAYRMADAMLGARK